MGDIHYSLKFKSDTDFKKIGLRVNGYEITSSTQFKRTVLPDGTQIALSQEEDCIELDVTSSVVDFSFRQRTRSKPEVSVLEETPTPVTRSQKRKSATPTLRKRRKTSVTK